LIWGVQPFHHRRLSGQVLTDTISSMTMHDLSGAGVDATAELLKVGESKLLEAAVVTEGETLIMMAGRLSGHGLSSSVIVWTIGKEIADR
jgi:hypothetical protein